MVDNIKKGKINMSIRITDYLRKHLLTTAGVASNQLKDSLDELKKSEWSPKFELLMRNRLIIGAFRYGKLNDPTKPQYNRIEAIQFHLDEYQERGNTEHLVDIANIALCEFVEGKHPKKHFKGVDDGKHAEIIKDPLLDSFKEV